MPWCTHKANNVLLLHAAVHHPQFASAHFPKRCLRLLPLLAHIPTAHTCACVHTPACAAFLRVHFPYAVLLKLPPAVWAACALITHKHTCIARKVCKADQPKPRLRPHVPLQMEARVLRGDCLCAHHACSEGLHCAQSQGENGLAEKSVHLQSDVQWCDHTMQNRQPLSTTGKRWAGVALN